MKESISRSESGEDEEEGGNLGLKVVGVIVGAVLLVGGAPVLGFMRHAEVAEQVTLLVVIVIMHIDMHSLIVKLILTHTTRSLHIILAYMLGMRVVYGIDDPLPSVGKVPVRPVQLFDARTVVHYGPHLLHLVVAIRPPLLQHLQAPLHIRVRPYGHIVIVRQPPLHDETLHVPRTYQLVEQIREPLLLHSAWSSRHPQESCPREPVPQHLIGTRLRMMSLIYHHQGKHPVHPLLRHGQFLYALHHYSPPFQFPGQSAPLQRLDRLVQDLPAVSHHQDTPLRQKPPQMFPDDRRQHHRV